MKKTLLIVLAFACIKVNAQYFQHTYGNTNMWDVLCDGITPQAGDPGYFMTGVTNPSNQPGELVIVRTDVNGNFGCTTCYNKSIPINTASFPSRQLEINQAKCVERTPFNPSLTGVIAVVAGWVDVTAGTRGVFYTDVAPPGGLNVGPMNLAIPGYNLSLGSVAKGPNDVLYVAGTASVPNQSSPFVIKFDMATYTIVWGKVFDITATPPGASQEEVFDIVEDLSNPGTVYVVGRISDINGTLASYNGFVLPINTLTGTAGTPLIYGNSGYQDYITSIRPSASSPAGFILGGYTQDRTNLRADMWAMKINPSGSVIWSTARDYNNGFPLPHNEYSSDIMERYNTSGNYEYYQIGTTDGSVFGGMDMIVYKLDANGNGVGGGQFTYQGGDVDQGVTLDFANPASDGLALFGNYDYGTGAQQREFYLVRAYYNGVTACNYDIRSQDANQSGPGHILSYSVHETGSATKSNLQPINPSVNDDDEICFISSDFGGNNAMVAPAADDKAGMQASPNPMAHADKGITLTVETALAGQATVVVYDMLGKQFYSNEFMLDEGNNALSVNLSGAGMAQGMYSVQVRGHNINKTLMLMVK